MQGLVKCAIHHGEYDAQNHDKGEDNPSQPGKCEHGGEDSAWLILLAPTEVTPDCLYRIV